MRNLTVSLIQCELAWESPEDNRRQIAQHIEGLDNIGDVIVLPEMFTTGFSMNALENAEQPGGDTEVWLQGLATRHDCAITGSIAVHGEGGIYNRMLFVTPKTSHSYDKRHLFRMAGEHRRYSAGNERVIVSWRGWRILLQVCYDLRFPVFSRNLEDYDLALYVANWPEKRRLHWRHLLVARAIENQAYVVGVNRLGNDANGFAYSGDSLAISADGELLLDLFDRAENATVELNAQRLLAYREKFPCQLDRDMFKLL